MTSMVLERMDVALRIAQSDCEQAMTRTIGTWHWPAYQCVVRRAARAVYDAGDVTVRDHTVLNQLGLELDPPTTLRLEDRRARSAVRFIPPVENLLRGVALITRDDDPLRPGASGAWLIRRGPRQV